MPANRLRNIIDRILGRDEPRKLRNKPGGMAWVTGLNAGNGNDTMNRCAVKTVGLMYEDMWQIEPSLSFTVTRTTYYAFHGVTVHPGDVVTVNGLRDEVLEPWRDIGDDEQDESHRYLPAAPKAAPAPIIGLPVREMQGADSFYSAMSTSSVPTAVCDVAPSTVIAAAHTGQGRPLE